MLLPLSRLSTRHKLLVASMLNRGFRLLRRLYGKPMQGEFLRSGIQWSLDLDEGIDFAIFLLGRFERDLGVSYEHRISPGSIVLDLGANIGAHTLPLARQVGACGRVIGVEATDYAVRKLRQNIALNPDLAPRIDLVHAVLVADHSASIEPSIHSSWPLNAPEGSTHPTLRGALKPVGAAPSTTVDQLVKDLSLPRVDWIKLDVDGHELSVLKGAQETLRRFRPSIFMELAPYCFADNPEDFGMLVGLLTRGGYSLARLPSGHRLPSVPDELVRRHIPHNGSINILAEPTIPLT